MFVDGDTVTTNDRIGDDALAAFIDGTLSADERASVMHSLAADPERYAEFLDAARIADEARTDNAPAGALTSASAIPRAKPHLSSWRRAAFLAAPILAAASLVLIVSRARNPTSADGFELLVSARLASVEGAGSVERALGAAWDETGWSVARGDHTGLAGTGAAARAGARVAQFELAAAAHDSIATRRAATRLDAALSAIDGAGPIALRLNSGSALSADTRVTLARQIRSLSGSPVSFDFGIWLMAARVRATMNDGAFFAAGSRGMSALGSLSAALRREPDAAQWNDALAHTQTITSRAPSALTEIRSQIDSALSAIPR